MESSGFKEKFSLILSLIDFTSLDGIDSNKSTIAHCRKAIGFKDLGLPAPAAVCVFSPYVETARHELAGTGIKVATVAGGFPHGQIPVQAKLAEVAFAIDKGTDEIDIVFSRGNFIGGNRQQVFDEIAAIRDMCRHQTLKVILETGELVSDQLISEASDMALKAGADFIKTSTGKIPSGATIQAVKVMLERIRSFHRSTGIKRGIKPSGGIADPESALMFYELVNSDLGESWLTKDLFRIGASRLAGNLANRILQG